MDYLKGNATGDSRPIRNYLRRVFVLGLSISILVMLSGQVSDSNIPEGPYLGQTPPHLIPVQFAKDIIPADLHSVPIFSMDGKSVFYKPMDQESIMVIRKMNSHWSIPMPLLISPDLNNSDDPCVSPADNKLFFSSYNKDDNREYIYFCDQNGSKLSLPHKPSGALNALDLHWQFSIAKNGNIYFSSNGNLYCSAFLNDSYKEPYKLDSTINTAFSECTPYVSPDESMLLFARSTGQKPNLYISLKGSDGKWKEARALRPEINTEHHEICPRITADGKYLFFISTREGLFSVYWVDAKVLDLSGQSL